MRLRTFSLCLLPLFLTACGPSAQQQADYSAVQESGVSPAIYDKMIHGEVLGIPDIAALGDARVNDSIIIRYVRDNETIYYLGPKDVDYLRHHHVSDSVIDYLLQTPREDWFGGPYPYGHPYGPPVSVGIGIGGVFH